MESQACCTIPPVVSDTDSYTEKGTYRMMEGMKTYVSGSSNATAKSGVLLIHDIFGLGFKQTLQGVDIIATSTGSVVVMPDLFDGAPMDIANYPPDTAAKKKTIGEFFAGPAAPSRALGIIAAQVVPQLGAMFPAVQRWAVVGHCWGGKVATLAASAPQTPFCAVAQLHPAMLDAADAAQLAVPALVIATKDEDKAAVDGFRVGLEKSAHENVRTKSSVLYWTGTYHGFMAARADLKDKDCCEYYKKGYETLTTWLNSVFKE